MQVRSFKLLTGQHLVAELVQVTGRGYIVKNPLVVHVLKGQNGEGHLAFAQWSMVDAPGVAVELYDHALISDPTALLNEVETSYIEQVTGLVLPASSSGQILHG